jgi:hypothetical protein
MQYSLCGRCFGALNGPGRAELKYSPCGRGTLRRIALRCLPRVLARVLARVARVLARVLARVAYPGCVSSIVAHGAEVGSSRAPHFDGANR